MNDCFEVTFSLPAFPARLYAERGARRALSCEAKDGSLRCELYYDSHDEPLSLEAPAKEGVAVRLAIMPHRIELYVDGELADEEWPCGAPLLGPDSRVMGDAPARVAPFAPETAGEPSVRGVFQGAEGWRPGERVFVGDCMPYVSEGRYHVLYLKDRRHHLSKWRLGAHQWEHISTDDFLNWQIHPTAAPITDEREGSICTGSFIETREAKYLFYTVRMANRAPAPIRRSVSSDGWHFQKDEAFGFFLSEKYDRAAARDPKIVAEASGLFHMFLTTGLVESGRGCLAHLVSDDLDSWRELDEPIYVSPDARRPECPDYIEFGGRYYLVYSLDGEARYLVSDEPFAGWRQPSNPKIPCGRVPKGALWGGGIVFTGFVTDHGYAGTMTFMRATGDARGELHFSPLPGGVYPDIPR